MSRGVERSADLRKSAVARYIQLSTLFRRKIESGQWRTGQQIPTIDELSEEFGVAPATIRQAIGLLEADGLVSRYRAKGTFVNAAPADRIWFNVETNWEGLLASRDGAQIDVLDRRVGPLVSAPHAIGHISPSYLHLHRRHMLGGNVFLIADVAIDEKLAAKIPEPFFTSKTALRLAASIPGVKIVDARQTLTVGAADFEAASALGIAVNAPVCFVDRSAVDQRGRLVLVARGIYRGDAVRVEVKLK
jgi:GntR family transcriptional regulator